MMNIDEFKWSDKDVLIQSGLIVEWRSVMDANDAMKLKSLIESGDVEVYAIDYNDDIEQNVLVFKKNDKYKFDERK